MKITETTPPPAPKPPRTFTLEISEQEAIILRNLLGRTSEATMPGSAEMYTALIAKVPR